MSWNQTDNVIPLRPRDRDRITIGYIHNGWVRSNFMMSAFRFAMQDSADRKVFHALREYCGLYVHQNRNALVREFLEDKDSNWLLCVDADIEFDFDIPYKLLDAADPKKRPIVSALYFTYVGENYMLESDIVPLWSHYTEGKGFEVVKQVYSDEVQKIDGCGFGCVLIHRSVFEKFQEHYEKVDTWFAHDLANAHGQDFRMGEDYSFCKRAMSLDIPIYGCGSAVVTHFKLTPLNLQTLIKTNQADVQYAKEVKP